MKIKVLLIACLLATNLSISQDMEKMNWLNQASTREVKDGNLKNESNT